MFEVFEGFGCFGETLVNTHWIAFWGVFYRLETNKTLVNTHWIAFWGVFHRLETNKTFVNGEWTAMYQSCLRASAKSLVTGAALTVHCTQSEKHFHITGHCCPDPFKSIHDMASRFRCESRVLCHGVTL